MLRPLNGGRSFPSFSRRLQMERIAHILAALSNGLKKLEKLVGAACLGAMLFIMLLNIFMRYLLLIPINWSDELNNYLFIWSGFLACAYTTSEDGHVRVTLIRDALPPKVRTFFHFLMNIIMLVAFALFIGPTWRLLGRLPLSNSLRVPLKYVYAILPIAFSMMCLHLFNNTVKDAILLFHAQQTVKRSGQ
jgi:TRAP-type C4-dicarboxylate transport system permease small subunit